MKQTIEHTAAVILAAGKGTRIGGTTSKVLRPLLGRPMIAYTVETLKQVPTKDIYVVTGHRAEDVQGALGREVEYVYQKEQLGTAHAVSCAIAQLPVDVETIIVLNGDDSAFYDLQTIRRLLDSHFDSDAVMTVLSATVDDPKGLGRIIRENGQVTSIIEEKDATTKQKQINEINTGCYIFDVNWLRATLSKIPLSQSGEYYIVDTLHMAVEGGKGVNVHGINGQQKWWGINTEAELKKANQIMFDQVARRLQPKVFFLDFDNTLTNTAKLKEEGMTEEIFRFFERNIGSDKAASQTKLFWKLYDEIKSELGWIAVPEIAFKIAKRMSLPDLGVPLKRVIYNLPFKDYVFPGVSGTLEFLRKFGQLVIVSDDNVVYGSAKIRGSGLDNKVDHIHIYQSKQDAFPELVKLYKHHDLYFIDDQLPNLEALHKLVECTSFWISTGPYANLKPKNPDFTPTHTISRFVQIEDIVRTWE